MADKEIKMTEDEFERRLGKTFGLGISSGLSQASNHLLDKAADLFIKNKDELAQHYRMLASELNGMSEIADKKARAANELTTSPNRNSAKRN